MKQQLKCKKVKIQIVDDDYVSINDDIVFEDVQYEMWEDGFSYLLWSDTACVFCCKEHYKNTADSILSFVSKHQLHLCGYHEPKPSHWCCECCKHDVTISIATKQYTGCFCFVNNNVCIPI